MKTVLIAGATGYLGRHLCRTYRQHGWQVWALVRRSGQTEGLEADRLVVAEATWPESLKGIMEGVDLVVSALGITRQSDGLGYWDVDYQANLNLLTEAERSGVARFAYVHVLNADRMSEVPMVAAKSAFVRRLQSSPIRATVIAPTGYFSDMADFFAGTKGGRAWLLGPGAQRINPIHGADLAEAIHDHVAAGSDWADIGGPETFTQNELAALCFDLRGLPCKITHLPDGLRRVLMWLLPRLAPRRVAGPLQFFLAASGMNMTAPPVGSRRLSAHFATLLQEEATQS